MNATPPDEDDWDEDEHDWAMQMREGWQPNEAFGWTWLCTMDGSRRLTPCSIRKGSFSAMCISVSAG